MKTKSEKITPKQNKRGFSKKRRNSFFLFTFFGLSKKTSILFCSFLLVLFNIFFLLKLYVFGEDLIQNIFQFKMQFKEMTLDTLRLFDFQPFIGVREPFFLSSFILSSSCSLVPLSSSFLFLLPSFLCLTYDSVFLCFSFLLCFFASMFFSFQSSPLFDSFSFSHSLIHFTGWSNKLLYSLVKLSSDEEKVDQKDQFPLRTPDPTKNNKRLKIAYVSSNYRNHAQGCPFNKELENKRRRKKKRRREEEKKTINGRKQEKKNNSLFSSFPFFFYLFF